VHDAVALQNAEEDILNQVVFQAYYRQLGMVSLHFGVDALYSAAEYLANGSRGGTLSWVLPGRLAQWDEVIVAPGFSDSPTISLWLVGSLYRQRNTVLVRKGWWTLYLPSVVERAVVSVRPPRLPS